MSKAEIGWSLRVLGSDLERLAEAVAERFELHRTDLRCLEITARYGPLSSGRLAAAAGLSTSAVTNVVDRMERVGYLQRVPDPHDRRRVLVEVTDRGRQDGRIAFAGLRRETERLLSDYSPAELEMLARFLEQVREAVTVEIDATAHAAQLPP